MACECKGGHALFRFVINSITVDAVLDFDPIGTICDGQAAGGVFSFAPATNDPVVAAAGYAAFMQGVLQGIDATADACYAELEPTGAEVTLLFGPNALALLGNVCGVTQWQICTSNLTTPPGPLADISYTEEWVDNKMFCCPEGPVEVCGICTSYHNLRRITRN